MGGKNFLKSKTIMPPYTNKNTEKVQGLIS